MDVPPLTFDSPQVLLTLSNDINRAQHAFDSVVTEGNAAHVSAAIQVAQLILKHRQNRNQHQRIIMFLGSPIGAALSGDELTAIGRRLKKNNISIDIVAMISEAGDLSAIDSLVRAAESVDGSHLIATSPGANAVMDAVMRTPSIAGEAVAHAAAAGVPMNDFDLDETLDPELALALRLSMEDEQARQARVAAAATTSNPNPNGSDGPEATHDRMDEDEDPDMARAIAMSMEKPAHS